MTAELYEQINNRVNPSDNRPTGLIFHSAGPSLDGGWRIIDVWDSRATCDRFLQEKVMPALVDIAGEAAAQGPPPQITSWPLHNYNVVA